MQCTLTIIPQRDLERSAVILGLPWWRSGKDSSCQYRSCRTCRFDPWVGKILWRRKWQPTPVFLPGKAHDGGAWWATVHGVTESQTRLSEQHFHFHHSVLFAVLVTKSCLTLCNPMDCSPPDSSLHGLSQARKLEWVVIHFSRGYF